MKKNARRSAVSNTQLLAFAHVGMDPVNERGRVSRGAYIVDASGTQYLTHAGKWTGGITGDHNWWSTQSEAVEFLRTIKAKETVRMFCGIKFRHISPCQWRSDSGILLCKSNIGSKMEKWSVEEHPQDQRLRGTGATIRQALENSSLTSA